jgi:hypothetical protein
MRKEARIREQSERVEDTRTPPLAAAPQQLLALQQTYGNAAVSRMVLARKNKKPTPEELAARFDEAVNAKDWGKAAVAATALDPVDLVEKLRAMGNASLDELVKAAPKESADFLERAVKFVRFDKQQDLDDPDERHFETKKAGKREGEPGKVAGGTVEGRSGGQHKFPGSEKRKDIPFVLSYKGEDAAITKYLQFISREMEVHRPGKTKLEAGNAVTGDGRKYPLTVAGDAHWIVDSTDLTDPFYPPTRGDREAAMLDMPSSAPQLAQAHFANPDEKKPSQVISRARFVTYVVRDMNVLHRFDTVVEWIFTGVDDPGKPKPPKIKGSSATKIDPALRETLLKIYSDYDFLP